MNEPKIVRTVREAQEMTLANEGLVGKCARRFTTPRDPAFPDLMQAGRMGLFEAAQRWEAVAKFSTYAMKWIFRRMIEQAIATRIVKVVRSRSSRVMLTKYKRTRGRLKAQGIEVTPAAIAGELGIPVADVAELMPLFDHASEVSLSTPIGEDRDSETMGDRLAGETVDPLETIQRGQVCRHVRFTLATLALDDRETRIVLQRFLADEPESFAEIGKSAGVSKQRMEQISKALMGRVRDNLALDRSDLI